jgi:shikimate kinase
MLASLQEKYVNKQAENTGNIFLVGPMGSGKSAVGRRLATDLRLDFHDSDEEIGVRTGVDISLIFDKEGEGTPVNRHNREQLVNRGTVVYLYTSVGEQLRRTAKSTHRPLLQCDDPGAVLEQLMQERDPLYREIADLTIETDGRQVASVAREIRQLLTPEN